MTQQDLRPQLADPAAKRINTGLQAGAEGKKKNEAALYELSHRNDLNVHQSVEKNVNGILQWRSSEEGTDLRKACRHEQCSGGQKVVGSLGDWSKEKEEVTMAPSLSIEFVPGD